ncbi:thiamine pyrophosphokinase [Paenibacillus baekrokdamisoli]|uniref:Thiamine diphosphokinase n=2 Tax=Paenibacillus baekrokdamisoli TaxID=1712516 RepID=A0A3G9J241_9BACL|nr:thiamine diphosphokinase [Paenibacillus baekrokdamisoli]MBB3070560.1 thiamine pyrophosphokinase [Paenibacillus baekrokdamisoli]BBH19911.1 thiamine pyrophosphokinase [Paenibacillus baekrokdamisoli]
MLIKRILIFTGGHLNEWALALIQPNDYLIGADAGALFLITNGYKPDVSLGDFDSVTAEELEVIRSNSSETLDFDPIDKDFTDTELAWQFALKKQPEEILLVGAIGTRFDHSLANVHLLRQAADQNILARIVDKHNCIRIVGNEMTLIRSSYTYVSLLPLTATVAGITLKGFQYPLDEATLQIGQSLGISNKLSEDSASIRIREGLLLVIESMD